jgi:hypothetical protein
MLAKSINHCTVAQHAALSRPTSYGWKTLWYRMGKINPTELAKLPHIKTTELNGRSVLLMPLWDGTAWNQWIDVPNGQLIKVQVVDTIRSNYLAKAPVAEHDVRIEFVEFMWQRASWPEVSRLIVGICDDFHLLATCAAKMEHFHQTCKSIDQSLISSFIQTELEYLIVVARSVFDLLQEIIAHFWNNRVRLSDSRVRTHKSVGMISGL